MAKTTKTGWVKIRCADCRRLTKSENSPYTYCTAPEMSAKAQPVLYPGSELILHVCSHFKEKSL